MLSFDHLSPVEFEEFCLDLLLSLDFEELNWRKGTSYSSSPADQGRDIQGLVRRKDVDRSSVVERWFIECKHHKNGVPPDKLQSAISWAMAERPSTLLFICSGFLSNPSKEYLEKFQVNNKPPFRIKFWEAKDLENLTANSTDLLKKYRLSKDIPFLAILNKYHLIYALKPQLNTVGYFLQLLDEMEPSVRDKAFQFMFSAMIMPRYRKAITGKETLNDLKVDKDDYQSFKVFCMDKGKVDDPGFVHRTVSFALSWIFSTGDTTSLDEVILRHKGVLAMTSSELENAQDPSKQEMLRGLTEFSQGMIDKLPEQTKTFHELYQSICNSFVRKLLAEKPF